MKHIAALLGVLSLGAVNAHTPLLNHSEPSVREANLRTLAFEENKGQVSGNDADQVLFVYKDKGMKVFLMPTGLAYQFHQYSSAGADAQSSVLTALSGHDQPVMRDVATYRMDMVLVGANQNAKISAVGQSTDYTHYYYADAMNVHMYEKVVYEEIYPDIDWVVYMSGDGIKYDFVVKPNGNPGLIQFQGRWVENMYLDEAGNLHLENRLGSVQEQRPVSYQNGRALATRFVLNDDKLSFELSGYNPGDTLIIDPQLIWGSYYGGESTDGISSVTTDSQGNVYFCGSTQSSNGIAEGGFLNNSPLSGGWFVAFLVKFTPDGDRVWGTYYGGGGFTAAFGCAVDSEDNLYMAGATSDFGGIASQGYQNNLAGNLDGFLVKFNAEGERIWGTYFGGSQDESFLCITIDQADNIYLAGETLSLNLPVLNAYQSTASAETGLTSEGFIVKFNVAGELLASTYFGGTGAERIFGIDHNASGDIFVAGSTTSTDLPTLNAHQGTIGSTFSNTPFDAFLAKFNAGSDLAWSTYYGGSDSDVGYSCATDNLGNVYLSGNTGSQNNIASGGFQNSISLGSASFLVKFNQNGVRQWGTYYGFSGNDFASNANFGWGCATDSENNVYMVGRTFGTENVAFQGFQNALSGFFTTDGYIAKFNATGTRLWASYYGGSGNDGLRGCHVDPSDQLYVVGQTSSDNNIFFQGFQSTQQFASGYIAKIGCPTPQLVNLPTEICANSSLQLAPLPLGGTLQLLGQGALFGTNYTAPDVNEITEVSFHYSISGSNFCPGANATFTLTVLPNTLASVSIASSELVICENDEVTFDADIENAGNSPAIQWLVNGVLVAENQTSFASSDISDGDVVVCIVEGTNICASPSTVQSNSIEITVNPNPIVSVVFNEVNGGLLITSSGFQTYQWFLNEVAIPGATGSTYAPAGNGLYTVLVTNEFDCESSASVEVITLSIADASNNEMLVVYPNPNDGNFRISYKNDIPQRLRIFDTLGKLVHETREFGPSESQISANLSKGVYYVSILINDAEGQYKILVQ